MAAGNQPFVCNLEVLKYEDSRFFSLENVHTKDFIDYPRQLCKCWWFLLKNIILYWLVTDNSLLVEK